MRRYLLRIAAGVLAGAALPAVAAAADAVTTSDLNMRAGPSTSYPVVEVVPDNARVNVYGCVSGYDWCDVSWRDNRGWVSAAYLSALYENRYVPLVEYGSAVDVPVVEFVFDTYWNSYYRGRPWYAHRARWRSYWHRHHRDTRADRRRDRREERVERREDRRDAKAERRENRRDARTDRRREHRQDRAERREHRRDMQADRRRERAQQLRQSRNARTERRRESRSQHGESRHGARIERRQHRAQRAMPRRHMESHGPGRTVHGGGSGGRALRGPGGGGRGMHSEGGGGGRRHGG